MEQRWARIATRGTQSSLIGVGCLAVLAVLASCSTPTSAGVGTGFLPDTSGNSLPGFDGFAFDVATSDVPGDSSPDGAGDLADDDTQTAVDDADDATAADSVSITCSQPCQIDDDCNPAADPCTATLCQFGCCQVAPTVGVACDDGIPCNGPDACKNGKCTPALPAGCDDALNCTSDSCDGEKCHHIVLDGWCHIGNTCVQAQAAIPGDPCKICDPTQDQDSWSKLSGCCQKDADCTAKGQCDKPTCDAIAGTCLIVKIPGCCKSDGDCDDGNLCTTDVCNTSDGNCTSTGVACGAPSDCQAASCDPVDGQCKPELLPGWCLIDGQCIGSNATNAANPCQICVPGNKPTSWSGTPGTLCNDNNACTFSDICTSTGECKGTAQPGCCQSDADCSNSGIPCKIGTCNTSVGLCAVSDKPGCCTAGICCDTVGQVIQPAGTACGTAVIGSDYQCSGADVQKRDFTAGCNGTSATVCANSTATGAPGAWATVSSCPPGTACTEVGSGVIPSCVNLGTCQGACGGTGSTGCSCAPGCAGAGTCCPDAQTLCGCVGGECCDLTTSLITSGPACQVNAASQFQCAGNVLRKRLGSGVCKGGATCATGPADLVWSAWTDVETCPNSCTAAADGSSGSCVAPAGTCVGVCGGWWVGQPCQCDTACVGKGNCCADYLTVGCDKVTGCYADSSHSCYDPNNGAMCGSTAANGCNCDISTCKAAGNCCPDAGFCCYF